MRWDVKWLKKVSKVFKTSDMLCWNENEILKMKYWIVFYVLLSLYLSMLYFFIFLYFTTIAIQLKCNFHQILWKNIADWHIFNKFAAQPSKNNNKTVKQL